MKEKKLEELLYQDMVQVLKNNEQSDEIIKKEIDDGLEGKSLVAMLKEWAKLPGVQDALKTMLVESVETKGICRDIMVVTITFGSAAGLEVIKKAKERVDAIKKAMEADGNGKDNIGHA